MNSVALLDLNNLSDAICDLYSAAETTSLEDFAPALISVLHRHLQFDGAVVGHADPLSYGEFAISVAHVHQRDASLLEEYKLVSAGDPVTNAFLQGLIEPLAADTERLYADKQHTAVLEYVRKHRLRHLLLCGHAPGLYHRGRWIVLYRSVDQSFDEATARWFGAFCRHLDRALDLNRDKALGQLASGASHKGVALIDMEGRVDKADALFTQLLKSEFRTASSDRLPQCMLQSMRQARVFEGRLIRGQFSTTGSHYICELRESSPLSRLSPRERQVAHRFGEGRHAREIAEEFGIALSTVHSQLASAYRKLGVSDKVTLSRILAQSES